LQQVQSAEIAADDGSFTSAFLNGVIRGGFGGKDGKWVVLKKAIFKRLFCVIGFCVAPFPS
jgi:hypothetical protein